MSSPFLTGMSMTARRLRCFQSSGRCFWPDGGLQTERVFQVLVRPEMALPESIKKY